MFAIWGFIIRSSYNQVKKGLSKSMQDINYNWNSEIKIFHSKFGNHQLKFRFRIYQRKFLISIWNSDRSILNLNNLIKLMDRSELPIRYSECSIWNSEFVYRNWINLKDT